MPEAHTQHFIKQLAREKEEEEMMLEKMLPNDDEDAKAWL
jgi:hypothetical protein